MSHDAYRHEDAAYVLGALAPGERQEYERHLQECEACRQAVAEVAGLPGLLARLDPHELDGTLAGHHPDDPPVEAVPETLLPRLLGEVAGSRRRRRARALAAGTAAAAAVAAVSVGVTLAVDGEPGPSGPGSTQVRATPMDQVEQTSLSARVAMEEVAWGTRLRITCRYQDGPYGSAAAPAYALVVHNRDGSEEQVATWRAVPGKPTTISAATAARPSEITSVEVRTTTGEPVLRLEG